MLFIYSFNYDPVMTFLDKQEEFLYRLSKSKKN